MKTKQHLRGAARTVIIGLAAMAMLAGLAGTARAQDHPQEPNRGGALDMASADVEVAKSRLKVADGFEVNLFASEQQFPELANPLAMTFDMRGRLWVLTSPTYPHYFPGEQPDDKLVIIEDTNEDGKADTLTVFADKLYLPMGFELGDGGAYVSQQPNLMFLRDTDGDDRADERRIVLHGFGTEDSHHALSAFTWGPGGGLYFQEGTFLHSQVETPYGPVRVENAAVFRYEPRTEKLSVFVSYPFANPWGHTVDRWGQNFVSDASNGNNYYGTAFSGHVDYPNKQRSMKEWTLTKVRPTSGVEFITSRHFPDDVQGNFLINNVIGFHGTKQYRTVEDGSGFVGIEVEPLLQSTDVNFRPVAMQFGPEGALYVVDWFNPLIGHMQFSLRDPRRDKTHGRVWRVTAKGRPLLTRPRIHGQPIQAQLDYLKAPEDRTRYWARLALREQPTDTLVPALRTWVSQLDASDAAYEHHLLEALWVLQHHDVVDRDLLGRVLEAKEFRARAAAVRVLQHWYDRVDDAMPLLAARVKDAEPRVRLEAVRALSFVPTAAAAELALEALRQPTDYYLQYVLDSTITTLAKAWKPALVAGEPLAADNPAGLSYLLARLEPQELTALPESTPVLHELLSRPGIAPEQRRTAVTALARSAGSSPVAELVAAIGRVDGTPGSTPVSRDLVQLLLTDDRSSLQGARADIERLAQRASNDVVRQGAWAALMRADGSTDAAWTRGSATPRGTLDLVNAVGMAEDPAVQSALYPRLVSLLEREAPERAAASSTLTGRYVRVTAPGRDRTLTLGEVEVYRGTTNLALKGTATQSSTVSGGAIGGHAPNAIDGRTNRTDGKDGSVDGTGISFTSQEQDPWWELDLGSDMAIDRIVVRAPADPLESRDGLLHVSVLSGTRAPVFARDGVSAREASSTLDPGGDVSGRLRAATMMALTRVAGHDETTIGLLARQLEQGRAPADAIAALRAVPIGRWPHAAVAPVARSVVAYAASLPPEARADASFRTLTAFGRDLTGAIAPAERQQIERTLEQLMVRTIRITAVAAQMRFDITQFRVRAGEDVQLQFVNADEMPHNLLVTAQGAMETVALAAEAMAATPDGFEKQFVPDSPLVLVATRLIGPGDSVELRFTAPKQPGSYPFVCTFPGHWRTMNGVMDVVRATPGSEAP